MAGEFVMARELPKSVRFHYIKADGCRDIPVHGVFGGINLGTGNVTVSVYAERPPIPREVVHGVDETGVLSAEDAAQRVSKEGVVRLVQATLYMDINMTLALHAWLGEKIEAFEKALSDQDATEEQDVTR